MLGKHPVQHIHIVEHHTAAAVVIVNSLGVEVGVIRNVQLQKLVDLAVGQTGLFVGSVEIGIGVPCFLRAVILIVL